MTSFEMELLESGFTAKDLNYLHKNISRYGSSLREVVLELGKRFAMVLGISAGVSLVFLALVLFAERHNIISGGISLIIVLLITWFFQPPIITYKAWRYRNLSLSSSQGR